MLPEARRNVFLLRYRAGTDAAPRRSFRVPSTRSRRVRRASRASSRRSPTSAGSRRSSRPFSRVVAVATLAHTLVSSVRRRRRELAVLRTMGFVRRQVWLSVFWQTATLVSIALIVGIPLGALMGRFAWNLFADDLGAIAEPQIACLRFLVTIPARSCSRAWSRRYRRGSPAARDREWCCAPE